MLQDVRGYDGTVPCAIALWAFEAHRIMLVVTHERSCYALEARSIRWVARVGQRKQEQPWGSFSSYMPVDARIHDNGPSSERVVCSSVARAGPGSV